MQQLRALNLSLFTVTVTDILISGQQLIKMSGTFKSPVLGVQELVHFTPKIHQGEQIRLRGLFATSGPVSGGKRTPQRPKGARESAPRRGGGGQGTARVPQRVQPPAARNSLSADAAPVSEVHKYVPQA